MLFVAHIGYSQQLVQNINDIHKLKENEAAFINKPLKDLLKEIKPKIETVVVFNDETASIFLFNFTTLEQQRKGEGNLADRLTLFVQVKESIPWQWEERPKGGELNWTRNDEEKCAKATVEKIEVLPENQD